jgi:hypothetical protein
MSDPLDPIRAQRDDFAALLGATQSLLAGTLDGVAVTAFRSDREAILARIGRREARVGEALAGSPSPALAALAAEYREVLEALAAAEGELARRAARTQDALGRELAGLVHGRRALSGYRSTGPGTPRAVSRHI